MHRLAVAVAAVALAACQSMAQGTISAAPPALAPNAVAADVQPPAWSCSASLFGYFVPNDQDYAQPTFAADRGRLHLEARYNYEALETGSAWLGYAFSAGRQLRMGLTPMLGGVFGDLHGIAPGYELTLGWSKLALDSEGEYVFDFEDNAEDFFYNWSELSIAPTGVWRAGLAIQRTRAYQTSLELQAGPLAGVSYRRLDLTAYASTSAGRTPPS